MKKAFLISLSLIMFLGMANLIHADGDEEYYEEELGIRKQTIYDEKNIMPATGEKTTIEAGSSEKFERAFENSPPLISHDVTDMLPIAQKDNLCLDCHIPEEAVSMGATPIPKSHFTELGTGKDLGDKLDGDRYNCMQCHVIQTTATPPVANIFKGEFRAEEQKYRSNLIDILNEGVE
ncbi:MAG: nitrate reductase cytochrome c-type subunit [Nitrospira sp.]|nr:nitrate reductase cytochrome c-type subunit [Nitrospira sp.]